MMEDFSNEEMPRNQPSVRHWLRYIEHKKGSPKHTVNVIFERALKELPGSYKLWYSYLGLRRRQIKGRCITDPSYEDVNNAFERSLVFMHKLYPEDTEDYIEYLISIGRLDEAAMKLAFIVNKEDFMSKHGKSNHQLWSELCELISKYPDKVR
ncbi:pre-mRNA-splicing factor SYF1-like isoform X1 [Cryptotermes secundus]|uniref:pre-mRNA-splicing factor SYF1-like isoform X1 n=1 Tax=Cryptotermes secundus TaxID=105785 RepID=UPI000CD7B9A6|nr:pre-mRNA-splicing factor SYF1-like isoform X1 [Cryptotermes secundus]